MSAEGDNGIFTIIPDSFESRTDHALVPNIPSEKEDFKMTPPYAGRSEMVKPSDYKLVQEIKPPTPKQVSPQASEPNVTPQVLHHRGLIRLPAVMKRNLLKVLPLSLNPRYKRKQVYPSQLEMNPREPNCLIWRV